MKAYLEEKKNLAYLIISVYVTSTFSHTVKLSPSQEPDCSLQCISEDESSSSSDDDTEVQNAFDTFIAQNHLIQPQSLSNDYKSIEADMEEPENTRGT